jgi:hypothetical protein
MWGTAITLIISVLLKISPWKGVISDIRNRSKFYLLDWTNGFSTGFRYVYFAWLDYQLIKKLIRIIRNRMAWSPTRGHQRHLRSLTTSTNHMPSYPPECTVCNRLWLVLIGGSSHTYSPLIGTNHMLCNLRVSLVMIRWTTDDMFWFACFIITRYQC